MAIRQFLLLLAIPVPLFMVGWEVTAFAQSRAYGVSVGVGVGGYGRPWGPGFGPGWGYGPGWGTGPGWGRGWGWGPGWGFMPTHYNGFYGNGMSMYGPPVPTSKPTAGVFGGGDSRYFPPPTSLGPAWLYETWIPLSGPRPLPGAITEPDVLPVPSPTPLPAPMALDDSAVMVIEVRVPDESAVVAFDGKSIPSSGRIREFTSPPVLRSRTHVYDVRIEWKVDGLTRTVTQRAVGRGGDRVLVDAE